MGNCVVRMDLCGFSTEHDAKPLAPELIQSVSSPLYWPTPFHQKKGLMEYGRPYARHTTLSAAPPPRRPISQPTANINRFIATSTDLSTDKQG